MSHIVDIVMPRLSDSMTEGTIVQWLKATGESVRMGEDLAEIETDKAQMTYGADQAGVLVEIIAQEGDTVALGEPIARMEVEGAPNPVETPAASPVPEAPTEQPAGAAQAPQSLPTQVETQTERVKISPAARVLAEESDMPFDHITGSGPDGRIVLEDVQSALQGTHPREKEAAAAQASQLDTRDATRIEKLIAKRMVLGKSAPEFASSRDVRIDRILEIREELKSSGSQLVPSINDFILKAVASALLDHPLLRSGWLETNWQEDQAQIIQHQEINLGMAVATPSTLLVPVIRSADQLTLGALSSQARELAVQAREMKLSPEQMEGAVFTISNLGGMGVTQFQAILVPGQAGILAVGAARPEVRWGDGGPEKHTLMNLTLTADHRLVYGSHAAQFLASLAHLLENPLGLML